MEVQIENLTNSVTGTTTATSTPVVTIDTRGMGTQGKTVFIINNTHATLTMFYVINGYVHPNSSYYVPVKASTSIGALTQVVSTDVDKQYAKLVLLVQDNSGHATYQVDYSTY